MLLKGTSYFPACGQGKWLLGSELGQVPALRVGAE